MKKILFTSLAVLGLGITGCSNEDLGVAKSGVDEVCATMGDAESRTAMNGNSVVWSIGDEIGIFVTNGSSSTYTNINYSLSSGAGTKNAGFSGVLEGESPVKKAAFYPYGSDASYDGSKISLTLYNPQIQISAESETKRSIFREKDKTKRSKKESAQHSKSRNKSFVMTSVSAL